jgi:hypothetical protein
MRLFHKLRRRVQPQPKRHTARLCLEILEDRTAPAVFAAPAQLGGALDPFRLPGGFHFFTPTALVKTQADLIAAINAANLAGGTNFITFEANITLSETSPFMSADGATGLPAIASGDNLTIFGNSFTLQRSFSEGNAAFRLFDVNPGASLTLDEMTLEGGLETGPIAVGGAINVHATANLTLNADTISSSDVSYTGGGSTVVILAGGAIYNAGTVNVMNSLIEADGANFILNNGLGQGDNQGDANNAAGSSGNNSGNGLTGNVLVEGGGIYNTGNMSITATSILDNVAIASVTNGSLNPGDVTGNGNFNGSNDTSANNGNGNGNGVVGNITVQGGGIYNVEVLSLHNDTISGNDALANITNGSGNGNNNSNADTGDNNGNNNGNGVVGNIAVAGGGIYNNNQANIYVDTVSNNFASCSVTNGNNNGGGDGVNTDSHDGNFNGDAVTGSISVSGGGITNDSAGSATLTLGSITQNFVSCGISNGNNNGDGDGDSNTGTDEGKNNGNGVFGFVEVSGGGLDNESGGHVTMSSTVSFNSATSSISNGSNNGNNSGNDDGNGCGLTSDLTLHGGGVRNAGTLYAFNATFYANSATSFIQNGSGDGNNCGDGDGRSEEGRSNGCGITGDVLIAGGAIANSNSGFLGVVFGTFSYNSVNSTVINGSNNGDNDGNNDGGNSNCGNNCGNAIGEGANSQANGQLDLEIVGGAIGNSGNAVVFGATITNNGVFSTITTGSGNGVGDGAANQSGVGDGNGVHGHGGAGRRHSQLRHPDPFLLQYFRQLGAQQRSERPRRHSPKRPAGRWHGHGGRLGHVWMRGPASGPSIH